MLTSTRVWKCENNSKMQNLYFYCMYLTQMLVGDDKVYAFEPHPLICGQKEGFIMPHLSWNQSIFCGLICGGLFNLIAWHDNPRILRVFLKPGFKATKKKIIHKRKSLYVFYKKNINCKVKEIMCNVIVCYL